MGGNNQVLEWRLSMKELIKILIINNQDFYFIFFTMLGIKPRALYMLDKGSTTKLRPHPVTRILLNLQGHTSVPPSKKDGGVGEGNCM
jgi:hypothetical protein